MNSVNPFKTADFLLPKDADLQKWAIIACDQYTSDPEYWEKARAFRGDAPSALNLILPEAELGAGDQDERTKAIRRKYSEYFGGDFMKEHTDSYIYIERSLKNGKTRCGILGAVDLEQYEPSRYATTLIRPSEETVFERVPPRVKVREKCAGEASHLVMFVDDDKKAIIEPLATAKANFEKLYDFDLPENGGHIAGWKVSKEEAERIDSILSKMSEKAYVSEKYGTDADAEPLLMVVGDGNHSLAAAKEAYEKIKAGLSPEEAASHPARYATAELVNIHTDAFEFEPIYRVVKGVDTANFLEELKAVTETEGEGQKVSFCYADGEGTAVFTEPTSQVTAGTLQRFIDNYIDDFGGECDYIHGEDELKALAAQEGCIGFLFDGISKDGLFRDIIKGGLLPRKSFSIGAADDKRFYLETRRITVPVKLITSRDALAEAAVMYNSEIFSAFNLFHMNIRGRKQKKNILTAIVVLVIGLILGASTVMSAIKAAQAANSAFTFNFGDYLFPIIFILAGTFWLPLNNKMTKKSLEMHWGNQTHLHTLVNIIRVSDEGIYVFSDNNSDTSENYLGFENINTIFETDTAFYIYFTFSNAVILTKEDIEKGSVEDLRKLFKEKLGNKFVDRYCKK